MTIYDPTFGAAARAEDAADVIEHVSIAARVLLRYGLAFVILCFGAMKFTAYEAEGIQPFVANSPYVGWVYAVLDPRTFSSLLGAAEIAIALMIAARRFAPRVAVAGGLLAAALFLGTLSFLLSTPGWEASLGGFPALSIVPGQFLLKDVVLLGAALWSAADALRPR